VLLLVSTVVVGFVFCWWLVSNLAVDAAGVEPFDVEQGGELELLGGAPRSLRQTSSVL
jgi:hypothetical protein